jgi:general stress protein 26
MKTEQNDLTHLASMIKDAKFTMMTTADASGALYSRPMANQKIEVDHFDGELWFFAGKNSHKMHEIEEDQHVNLSYSNLAKNQYVSANGTARIIQDKHKMKELWTPMLKAWFPEGLDDPNLALICVTVITAEIWDAPSSKMVQLVGFAKAIITGKKREQGLTNKIVDLHH